MTNSAPLLSICIPTYSRSGMLDACLASVLPQAQQMDGKVECVVSDNASTDNTDQVIEKYKRDFSFEYERNKTNLGILGNITKVAGHSARGDFVWLLGDDDVVTRGAVGRIVAFLENAPAIDLVALNVGYRSGDLRPDSKEAFGGITTTPMHLMRKSTASGVFPFEQLLEGPNVDFTAMYSLVLRRSYWVDEFPAPYDGKPFIDVRSTYPHAYIIANRLPCKKAGLIVEPAVMIHELGGEQYSWAKYRALTLVYATQLFELYEDNGIPKQVLEPYFRYQLTNRADALGDLIWNRECDGGFGEAFTFARMMRKYPWLLLKALCIAMTHRDAPVILAAPFRALLFLKQRLGRRIRVTKPQ